MIDKKPRKNVVCININIEYIIKKEFWTNTAGWIMNQVFSSIYEHVIVLKFVNALENNLPQNMLYLSWRLTQVTRPVWKSSRHFPVTQKMVKCSNITRNIFILDLNDFTCIKSIRSFVWERWQTWLCFCPGALNRVMIAVLNIALNFDSFQ